MGNSSSMLAEKVGGAIATVLRPLIDLFAKNPMDANNTMRQIKAENERLEADKLRIAQAEAEWRKRESASTEREKAALSAAEEARRQEAAARSREEAALAKASEATNALQQGIRPIVMPTSAQVQAAMKQIDYNPEKLHFAVCGTSGSGKSSLINAFRGLGPREGGAAAVGVTETTSKVTRYPDPRSEFPYARFVWYDIPGAGTTRVPDWQYFNDQGLFVFDFIVTVYDVRFTKIDVGIIENCYRFDIPVFIVRSKADQHIDNIMKEEDIDAKPGDAAYEEIYQETKLKYVEATRSDFDKHMGVMAESPELDARDRQMILSQRVYIVSGANVRGLLRSGVRNCRAGVDRSKDIDEILLVEDMLRAAARRRYTKPEGKGLFEKGGVAFLAGITSAMRLGSEAPSNDNAGRSSVERGAYQTLAGEKFGTWELDGPRVLAQNP